MSLLKDSVWIGSLANQALRENDAWKAGNAECMEGDGRSTKEGKVRTIGVSNFMQHHLEALMETAEIVPASIKSFWLQSCDQEDLVAIAKRARYR